MKASESGCDGQFFVMPSHIIPPTCGNTPCTLLVYDVGVVNSAQCVGCVGC